MKKVNSLIGEEVETLERKVRYKISSVTERNIKFDKVETSTRIYVPKQAFCNAIEDLSRNWIPIRPAKEKKGYGYDGILKEKYTSTMISHVVAPTLVKIGLCEVRKNKRHWEIRLL